MNYVLAKVDESIKVVMENSNKCRTLATIII